MFIWTTRAVILILLGLLPLNIFSQSGGFGFEHMNEEKEHATAEVTGSHEDTKSEQEPVAHRVIEPEKSEAKSTQNNHDEKHEPAIEPAAVKAQEPVKIDEKKVESVVTDTEKKSAQVEESDVEIKGIDTVNLEEPQGNWLFKRIWWERAEDKYEKARALAEQIFELRMAFFNQRSDLNKDVFDPFYLSIGLSQGELKTIVAELLNKIEMMREQVGSLTVEQREFFEKLTAQKAALEQIALDVAGIAALDQEIDKYLNILMNQINRVRGYERDAWQFFKEISRELSDKKAREIYFKMDTILKNIASVHDYLEKDFSGSFSKQVEMARSQVERLKTAVQDLKTKDVDLKKQLETLIAEQQAKQNGAQPVVQPEEDEEDNEQPGFINNYIVAPVMTCFSYCGSFIKSIWNGLVYIVWWPIEKIMGSKSHDDELVHESREPSAQPIVPEPKKTEEKSVPEVEPQSIHEQEMQTPQAEQPQVADGHELQPSAHEQQTVAPQSLQPTAEIESEGERQASMDMTHQETLELPEKEEQAIISVPEVPMPAHQELESMHEEPATNVMEDTAKVAQ